MMERTLKGLFDFQKFENNSALRSVIDSTHSRYGTRELSLDSLEQVFAAGTPLPRDPKKDSDR